jgi:hypothetical protein
MDIEFQVLEYLLHAVREFVRNNSAWHSFVITGCEAGDTWLDRSILNLAAGVRLLVDVEDPEVPLIRLQDLLKLREPLHVRRPSALSTANWAERLCMREQEPACKPVPSHPSGTRRFRGWLKEISVYDHKEGRKLYTNVRRARLMVPQYKALRHNSAKCGRAECIRTPDECETITLPASRIVLNIACFACHTDHVAVDRTARDKRKSTHCRCMRMPLLCSVCSAHRQAAGGNSSGRKGDLAAVA